jgi:hypothetical protein
LSVDAEGEGAWESEGVGTRERLRRKRLMGPTVVED